MASQTDYLKPRNKEMRDLARNLPYPLRVKDTKGKLVWQNRAAETSEETEWSSSATSWQGKKAVLELPARVARSQVQGQVAELEEEIERLKKQQRQTARKKRQAESAAQKRDKTADARDKREQKLQSKLDKALKDNQAIKAELAEIKKTAKSKAKKPDSKSTAKQTDNLKAQIAQLESELVQKSEAHAAAITQANSFLEQREKEHDVALKALREELVSENSEASEASNSASLEELSQLKEDKTALESWVEDLEQKHTELREKNRSLEKRLAEVQTDFYEFQAKVEEEDAQRHLEEQLAQKVQEFEELERRLEEEQQAFDQQRQELQQKLSAQEEEFQHIKAGVESQSDEQDSVASSELDELREELADSKADLQLAARKERRLAEKIATLEELRGEHGNVLTMLKEDLKESRERERELKGTIKLYSDLRKEKGNQEDEIKGLKDKLEAQARAEVELQVELKAARLALDKSQAATHSSDEVSVPMKNQLDFLKKRLADAEGELDQASARLKEERAQNQSSKESERLAFQDSLTGLPNHHMVGRYLKFANQQAQASGRSVGLFLIDIDGFRVLNETYGRDWGDALLRAVGERLNGMRGKSHLVARHSQDRFILLAAELEKNQAQTFVSQASKSLLEALAYPFEVEGEEICLTATIGVSLGPVTGDALETLYTQAEVALDSAKRKSAAIYRLYDEQLRMAAERESTYGKQMAHAIGKDEFRSVFQPVFHLTKGGVFGLELLTRWQHRDQRTLLPAEFLEASIKSGLLFKITERLWPKAFADFAKWQKMRPGLTLSINLCDKELLSPTLLKKAIAWTKEAQIDPKFIIFEVRDQSRLRLTSSWWKILQDYNKAGFGLCLDDFATDASLFGTLAYGGFRQAKLAVDEKSPKLVISPHAAKGVEYCAKGLQNKFDPKALTKAGFSLAQGFAVSRPLDNDDVDMVFL